MFTILSAVALVAFGWMFVLHCRVQKQTAIIEEKLQNEAALKERYVQLFENVNEVIFTLDLNGRFTSINKAGERLLQRNRNEMISLKLVELMAEGQRPAARRWLEQIMKGDSSPSVEWDFLSATGQRVKLEINARLIEQAGKYREIEGMARDMAEQKRLEKEILEVSNKEQQRIGHDLHDGICQQLAAVAYRTHIVARRLEGKGVAESAEVEDIVDLINESLVQTRQVAQGLFPVRLEENGLASALSELSANINGLYKVNCSFSSDGTLPTLDNSVALHVYYIAQEAIMNAAKHGKAENIVVRLEPAEDRWLLTIQDDGIGFKVTDSRTGMGIGIMQYRARVIGAILDLKTELGRGKKITCEFYSISRELVANQR